VEPSTKQFLKSGKIITVYSRQSEIECSTYYLPARHFPES